MKNNMTKLNIVYIVNEDWSIYKRHNDWLVVWKKTLYKTFPIRGNWELAHNMSSEMRWNKLLTLREAKNKAIKIENIRHKEKIASIELIK